MRNYLLGLTAAVVLGASSAAVGAEGREGVPELDHVFVIVLENHNSFTSFGDTNVGLIVSSPNLPAQTIRTLVLSSQVAPTILQSLGIDPKELKSVRVEGTRVLPGL